MIPIRSTRRRAIGVAAAALTAAGLVTVPSVPAAAAPAPSGAAAFGATGESDGIAIRNLTAAGLDLAGLRVGATSSVLDNGGSPIRSTATSSNIGGTVTAAGLSVDSDTQTAPPDHLTPSTSQLLGASLAGVLAAGAGTASDLARYPADASVCLPAGTALTDTSNRTAGVNLLSTVSVPGITPVVRTGDLTTTTTTSLPQVTPGTRGVLSRSSATIAGVTLLGGAATVNVSNTPTLEAFAAGTAAPQRFGYATAPTASITIGGTTTDLTATVQTFNVSVGTGLNLVTATITARIGTPNSTVNTPGHVAGTATAVELTVNAAALGVPVASTAIGIGQMSVDTTSPTDGVLCANDVTAVAAPVITAPAPGSTIATATPVIRGTGVVGATVRVTDAGGGTLGTTVVGGDGTWSLTPTAPFANGQVTIGATQTVNGETSVAASDTFTVAAPAPAVPAPQFTAPVAGSTTTDATPAITGLGTVGAGVTVFDQASNVLGSATVAADGTWTVTPTVPFANGPVTIRATQTVDGTTSPSASDSFTVAAPVPVSAPVITAPVQGSLVLTGRPPITGTGTAGATVDVIDGTGATVGTTVVAADGTWTVTPTTAFPDGPVTVRATQTVGTQTSPADSVDFRVVTPVALAAPTVTAPAPGSTVTDHTPDITGRGVPGAVITVRDLAGNTIASSVVDLAGNYVATPAAALPDGSITVFVSQSLLTQVSSSTADTFTVATPVPIPAAPTITSPADGSTTTNPRPPVTGTGIAGAAITVTDGTGTTIGTGTVAGDGTYSVTPISALPAGPVTIRVTQTVGGQVSPAASVSITVTAPVTVAPPVITTPATGSTQTDPRPLITGTGIVGAVVTVREGSTVIGTATVGANGGYALLPASPFADGLHTISATQTTADGTSPASAANIFLVAAPVQLLIAPTITSPAQGATVTTGTPIIRGTGLPGATVTVQQIGQGFQGSTVVGLDGTWSLLPSPGFATGVTTIVATQTLAGRVSTSSLPDTFVVALPVGQAPGGTLTDLQPSRILDTRTGNGLAPGDTGARRLVVLQVTGRGGVPADGRVNSVVLNVTATHTVTSGVVTVYPNGSAAPTASNLNTVSGQEKANLVTVPVGPDGKVVLSSTTTTDLVADVQGWYSTPQFANRLVGRYQPLEPARLVDSRTGLGGVAAPTANSTRSFQVIGRGGVPVVNVSAVVLNVTVVHPTGRGYAEVYPSGTARPTASNVNFEADQTRANRVVVAPGVGGRVDLYNLAGRTDVVVDVTGYYTNGIDDGAYYVGVSPRRVVDSRTTSYAGQPTGRFGVDSVRTVKISGIAGLPAADAPNAPMAVLANVTAVSPAGPGHMTFYPSNLALPVASDLNYALAEIVPNLQIGRLDPFGAENVQAHGALVDLVVDVDGYFTEGTATTN